MGLLHIAEDFKVLWGGGPIDITGAGLSSDWVNLSKCHRLAVIFQQAAWAGGTSAVTLEQATDASGTGGKALAFTKRWLGTGLTDDNYTETAVTSNTFTLPATANTVNLLSVDSSELDIDGGFTWFRAVCATPGSNADLLSITLIAMNLRDKQADPPTMIA